MAEKSRQCQTPKEPVDETSIFQAHVIEKAVYSVGSAVEKATVFQTHGGCEVSDRSSDAPDDVASGIGGSSNDRACRSGEPVEKAAWACVGDWDGEGGRGQRGEEDERSIHFEKK
ncbi:hypothetical protein N0V82_004459 [Gnomoniopsis sp. IMI 355080]|nr:hypothetical protein N0V82_004459 [Gnomoniopsis sp. IMI 355080]